MLVSLTVEMREEKGQALMEEGRLRCQEAVVVEQDALEELPSSTQMMSVVLGCVQCKLQGQEQLVPAQQILVEFHLVVAYVEAG